MKRTLAVDLHHLTRREALQAVEYVLSNTVCPLRLITGKGLHSPNQKPVVRPAVEKYLERNGAWWSHAVYDDPLRNSWKQLGRVNTGALDVFRP